MDIAKLVQEYEDLELSRVVDYEKFNSYSIVHHSSSIEGSTLTETDTQLLLDEGITPAGKPLEHSLMVKDHYDALKLVLSDFPDELTLAFIQRINAKVMAEIGHIYQTPLGTVDASKGELRKGNVTAGGAYFPNYDKVERLTNELVAYLNKEMPKAATLEDKLKLSFDAHFILVGIHPFYDGNGRTSRLLMNGIQHKFGLPLAIVFKEDKSLYFEALNQSRQDESKEPFYNFMFAQYGKHLKRTIDTYKRGINQDSTSFFK